MQHRIFFKGLLVLFIGLGFASTGTAQQQSQYTQFMYNQLTINPAYAGSRGVPSLMALYRNQWMGFEGAPKTQLVGFNAPLFGDRVGFGLTVSNHNIGVMNSWYGAMAYSYHIPISETASFRLGLQGNMRSLGLDFTDPSVVIRQEGDGSILENQTISNFSGNFGAGIYLTVKNFYFGLSAPYIFPTEFGINKDQNILEIAKETPHFYGMVGTMIKAGSKFHLKPAALVKYVQNAPLDLDLNLSFVYDLRLTAGISYRMGGDGAGDSVDLLAMYQINNIGFGLAYDYNLSQLNNYNNGSIEALIRFDFIKEQADMANPRFFF